MAARRLTFAGSTVGEPWWTIGEIVAQVLKPHGYRVSITDESFGDNNVRWVTAKKAQIGVTTPVLMRSAVRGVHEFKGERHRGLAHIATVLRPNWLALAIRHDIGISDLREVKRRKYPLRILAPNPDPGSYLDTVLRHYGTSLEEIESWGGRFMKWSGRLLGGHVREGAVDLMLGNLYLGYTPHNRFWYEATMLYDMRFLEFEESLIEELVQKFGYLRATIPHGLFRGLDRDIASVGTDAVYIYCLKDQPAKLVRLVAAGLDENSELFRNVRSAMYYERSQVWKNDVIPLHPAAEQYYRAQGYMA
ncbi:MAG TPA: TAXI family TRAP transporter solute-binding subunit [Candidatus Acidoferrales bacterium]|nr:TAXI family TRAP transporter solute-binding subunit [Candidatus Acidoferrales bacterium]